MLPESLLGKAIGYARNQRQHLYCHVDVGAALMDNNLIERDIRPFFADRKPWLFADAVAGAKASAIIYSLMLTCRACGVEPFIYLCHVLTELGQRAPKSDVTELLPLTSPGRPRRTHRRRHDPIAPALPTRHPRTLPIVAKNRRVRYDSSGAWTIRT